LFRKAKRDLTIEEQLARGPVDLPFLTLVLLLLCVGLLMLLSASYPSAYYNLDASVDTGGNPYYYFMRQGGFAAAGLAAMFIISKIDFQRFRWMSVLVLGAAIVLMLLVFTPMGRSVGEARRWLVIFGIRFQPSEIAKVGVIMFFAARLSKRKDGLEVHRKWNRRTSLGRFGEFIDRIGLWELIPYAAVLGVIVGILAMQKHMSGTILILIGAASVLFASGVSLGWFALGGTAVAGALWFIVTKTNYMTARINAWQDPTSDLKGSGYQLWQSQIAIGSGGLLGLGLGNGKQKFLFLPEEHNDCIFAIVCEELGLVGAGVIILLFMLLIIRGYWLAIHARDRFGTLLVVGITTLLAAQVIFNIAVVTGTIPTTGISLPFFSYGGTALMIQLAEMGMILSVSRQIPAARAG